MLLDLWPQIGVHQVGDSAPPLIWARPKPPPTLTQIRHRRDEELLLVLAAKALLTP